ncbi:MAG: anthranilate synthase component I [Methanosarcinaceae archaeon]
MISFDLDNSEFKDLVQQNEGPALVQLMANVDTICSPLQLYTLLQQESEYSYLLESVEKEHRHARFSFVGAYPDVVVSISNRELTLQYCDNSQLIDMIRGTIVSACDIISDTEGMLQARVKDGQDVLDSLRAVFPTADGTQLLHGTRFERQTFLGGAIGYNGYDMIYDCWLDEARRFGSNTPDMQFMFTTKTFVFDHMTDEIHIVVTPPVDRDCDAGSIYQHSLDSARQMYDSLVQASDVDVEAKVSSTPSSSVDGDFVCSMDQKTYENAVIRAKQHIVDGDVFQVVVSRRCSITTEQSPLELYLTLRKINPSPYMYLFRFKDLSIVGASPETLMTVFERQLIINPIAGTCPRGSSKEEDEEYAHRMMGDEKERAEHVMLVDLGRNDVRMVSEGGSVTVDEFMSVVKYSHVQHIESTVSGQLRDECDQFDATRAIFPAGTLSGAPKIRAMELINELETTSRGIYGGGVGYYSWNGDVDLAIAIRTAILEGNVAHVQAGAGIVADSVPSSEYEETGRKMAAMLKCLGGGQ